MTTEIVPTHSPIGASSYYRWRACPGSVRLSKGLVSRSSAYAEEGTLAHEMAADRLVQGYWPKTISEEMKEHLLIYTDTVRQDYEACDAAPIHFKIEHRFDLSEIHKGLYGTADAVLYDPTLKILHVYDLKYGAGIAVDVEDNEQLKYYGLGALLSMKVPCTAVELIIVQPRCEHAEGRVRRWSFPAVDLLDFAADLERDAKATEAPDAPLNPGGHCRFCPAAGLCPALKGRAVELAKLEFSSSLSYNPAKLAQALDWLPALEGFIKNVREFAYGEAEHGRCPPGYKLVQKVARRKWRDEGEARKAFYSDARMFESSLKSPTQVEKILGKKEYEKISEHVVAESSGLTLVHESDKRPPARGDILSEFDLIE